MDPLSIILQRFSMNTEVFFTGNLCGISNFNREPNKGHLHLLQAGEITIVDEHGKAQVINEPSVLFFPSQHAHRVIASEDNPPKLVCANVMYNESCANPIAEALPRLLLFKLSDNQALMQAAQWLFTEAFTDSRGRHAMLNSLTDIFIIYILRHVLDNNIMQHGLLAGLAHPQLSNVLLAIHQAPEQAWGLEDMATIALMSRSKFADLFKRTVGQSPGDYVIDWRIIVAKGLLQQNKPVSMVANAVGYENGSALARVFRKKLGISPKQWLEQTVNSLPANDE